MRSEAVAKGAHQDEAAKAALLAMPEDLVDREHDLQQDQDDDHLLQAQ
jgi:hypothetical protein